MQDKSGAHELTRQKISPGFMYGKLNTQESVGKPRKNHHSNLIVDRNNFIKSETKIERLISNQHYFSPSKVWSEIACDQERMDIINKIMQQKQEIKILEALVN